MRAPAPALALVFAAALLPASATAQDMTQQTLTDDAAEAADPRLWLEEVEGERALAQVREWNSRTLDRLKADPLYDELYAAALEIVNSQDKIPAPGLRGGHVYNFWQDEDHVRGLWRRTSVESYLTPRPDWDVLIDIDALAEDEGRNWVYAGVDCAPPDYVRCLVSLSDGGSDAAIRREFDLETRSWPEDGFDVPIAKSGSAWEDPDTLLLTTDWGQAENGPSLTESGYPFIVKRLKRGQALGEAEEVYRGEEKDVAVSVSVIREDGQRWTIFTRAVTFYESEYYLQDADGTRVLVPLPARSAIEDIHDGYLIASLQEDMAGTDLRSGDLIALDLAGVMAGGDGAPELVWRPGERSALSGAGTTGAGLLVMTTRNVQGEAFLYRRADGGWTGTAIPLPENAVLGVATAHRDDTRAFFNSETMLEPDTLYFADLESMRLEPAKRLPEWFDAETMEVDQWEAESSDGTKIPYFVMRRKDAPMDGSNPTLLYGYGGFQVSMDPAYSATRGRMWVARGGVFVLANIRGGGEFGPAWHQAGLKTKRQIIYDDFIAVGEDLVARGVATPDTLGIQGGSNGGLLMGVMFTQRPDLFKAVLCEVPLLDMLRYDRLLAGASWVGEYGSPSIPEERAFLESISPYHNVRPGVDYPDIFFVTSTKDDRVHPGHARKMAALLEESGYGFDYYENIDGGHSAAANLIETANRYALEFTWMWRELTDESAQ